MKRILFIAACTSLVLASCGKDSGSGNSDNGSDEVIIQNTWPESGYSGSNYWYLSNGTVQIGVDLTRGGCVFHFSESTKKTNLINHYDNGRFIQQSYYDGTLDGSEWNGNQWRWNPIQGGGWRDGTGATILSKNKTDSDIEIETEPVHWATCEALPECDMTETITLGDNYAKIHYTFTNSGTGASDHTQYDQELPAVFCDYSLENFVSYTGDSPWTGDTLTTVTDVTSVTDWPFTQAISSECWAAYVDDTGWGIGVYTPQSTGTQGEDPDENLGKVRYSAYRAEGTTGPTGSGCSYFGPHAKKTITKGFSFEYNVYLAIGTIDDIRATFKNIYENNL